MPLPLILGVIAGISAITGAIWGTSGFQKQSEARNKHREAQGRHDSNVHRLQRQLRQTNTVMDDLGRKELRAFRSFGRLADSLEKIQQRSPFKIIHLEGKPFQIPQPEKLKEVSMGANLLLSGISSAAAGTAGAFAASGATTAAVTAFGTASTGTAISSLTGIAATKATLATLGGGSLAAGGGGIALGTAVLGASTLGISVMIGGLIFNIAGSKQLEKVNRAYDEMLKAERDINRSCQFLKELQQTGERFRRTFVKVQTQYDRYCNNVFRIVNIRRKRNWQEFTDEEKLIVENTMLLATLLYSMCKVKLVLKTSSFQGLNRVNKFEVTRAIESCEKGLGHVRAKRTYASRI